MTESMSIVEQERASSAEQATTSAGHALQRAGLENATPQTVEFLAGQFAPLEKMRGILKQYGDTINTITDNVDADEEERIAAYAELRNTLMPQYEEAAAQLKAEIAERRKQYQSDVFGIPESSSPTAAPADKNTAAMNYRDALYRLQGATSEEFDNAATLAEASGDRAMLRAIGLVAGQRGDLANVYRYLQVAGEKTMERYTARNMLPTESTVGALIGSCEPPRIGRAALAPSPHVVEARHRQKQQRRFRDNSIFRP